MTIEERAANFRDRVKSDITSTMRQHLAGSDALVSDDLLDALVGDATFHIEHLLCEIEDLQDELRLHQEKGQADATTP